jgi:hypothetical protein
VHITTASISLRKRALKEQQRKRSERDAAD